MIARVLCATAQSEQAAEAMAELWGEQVGRFERTAPGFQGACCCARGPGGGSSSCACRRGGGPRPRSPLQPAATVYLAEATGGRWLHVRIDYREYSIPLGAFRRRYRLP